MNKTVIVSLAILTVFLIPVLAVFGSTGTAAIPIWTDCRGSHVHGNIEVGGAVGQDSVVVSWNSYASDWIQEDTASGLKCNPFPFTQSIVDVHVVHGTVAWVPSTVICHSVSCSDGFTLLHTVCTKNFGCVTRPYTLVYGDDVVVDVTTSYTDGETHSGSYTLAVTD